MKRKKILVDLSCLKHPYCGIGQVARNYGEYFSQNYFRSQADFDLFLLLPENWRGKFGNEVKYVNTCYFLRKFPVFIPRVDVWHAIHQYVRFRPADKSTKYILTVHDCNFMYEYKEMPDKMRRHFRKIRVNVDRADKIITISRFAKQDIERCFDLHGKSVGIIYNGVELLDTGLAKQPVFVQNENPFFFTIGHITEKKNFHVLLPLMKYFPEKELYIVGDKDTGYGDFIERKIREEKLQNVHLTGIVSNEERIWLYRHCEAFLFPSLYEGFGLPVIEAMQLGKPVFSSKETSLKEIGGDCAFFWDSFDPLAMKCVIDSYLSSFQHNPSLAEKNRLYALSFSREKAMEQYLAVYRDLLPSSKK
jgi:glycosyltransferase involved in cell wall biosynthesis